MKISKIDKSLTPVEYGTNPCSEIILRPMAFCNLTEVVVRSDDTFESLKKKVRIASILGTIQSTFTDFKYLRKIWKDNCEEERLLGVSLTGVCDNLELLSDENLAALRSVVVETNRVWAERLGIPQSVATTCVKPSGTVSQLVGSSSGLHPAYASKYVRTVRADNKDPLTQFLIEQGVPNEPDLRVPDSTTIFSFPVEAAASAVTRKQMSAIDQLVLWKRLQDHWCEHKPSCTVYVRDDEWMDVGAWVWKNFDDLSGVSFLPYDNGTYKQAPYQEVSDEAFESLKAQMPSAIDWTALAEYETEDRTTGAQEYACSGGVCEIVSIGDVKDG